jgi:type III pantothenate kinase
MQLAIDLGNTYAKTGLFEADKLLEIHWKLSLDDLATYVQQVNPLRIIISSVSYSFVEILQLFNGVKAEIVFLNSTTLLPISKNYDTPETLGADRLAATIGATVLFPAQNNVVIDMGTCITYDLIDANHIFQGGIISPGMQMRFKAMNTFTKRLPLLNAPTEMPALIGKSTTTAMQSGVMNALVAEINGLIEQYSSDLTKINVIFCGGDATFFANRIKYPNFVVPELVLIGLNRILDYNVRRNK